MYLYFDGVNYQCHQWKMALNLHTELPDPTDHDWVNEDNGSLGIRLTECKPAKEPIL